jgi:DNA-binding NarL/FixJ family response regulator
MALTERQLQILTLLSHGECYDSIAAKLDPPSSEATIKNMACATFKEMGVTNRVEAVATALRAKWIE